MGAKKPNKNGKSTIIQKLEQDSFSWLLSFILSTALVGGSSYVLFQLPKELDSIHRQVKEYGHSAIGVSYYNEIMVIYTSGWFADEKEHRRRNEILNYITANKSLKIPDQKFKSESVQWIFTALPRLNSEKGKIEGFTLPNETERSSQGEMIHQYSIEIIVLMKMNEILNNWEAQLVSDRDKTLDSLIPLLSEAQSSLESVTSKASQLMNENKIAKENSDMTSHELNTQIRIIWLKEIFSIIGIIAGVVILCFLGFVVIRKWKSK